MSDKIALYMGVLIDGVIEWWQLGEFMIVDVDGYTLNLADESIKLQQSRVLTKKVFTKGSLYTDALKWFLITSNLIKFDIQQSDLVLQADIIIDDSKSKLAWFNHIADQINYTHLHVSNDGYFTSKKYQEPRFDKVTNEYKSDRYSVISSIEGKVDYWNVPNVFKRTVSRGDLPPLTSIYINDSPTSSFSTTSRGFEIADIDTVDLISTQEELDLLVSRIALKAQQVEEVVKIQTINMPTHSIYDIIQLEDNLFEEVSYSIDLSNNGMMTHYLRRVVYGFAGTK